MSKRTALPIGSVVRVKEGAEPFMIVNQCPVTEKNGTQGYFDFGAVTLPLGLVNQNIIFFNKEDIDEVLFIGYIDRRFQEFLSRYDEEVGKISYDRFTVEEFKNRVGIPRVFSWDFL